MLIWELANAFWRKGLLMDGIKTVDLTKKYGKLTAVDKLSLTVPKGELFALLGVNGAGKTTAIQLLACLTLPTAGDAFLNGKSIVTRQGEVKGEIALSPQETAVAPSLTVGENLELMCGVYGMKKQAAREKARALRERLGLGEVWSRRAGRLSGGWQRRLSIAMALAGEPSVLFLDEPTLGLDVLARSELWDLIRELKGAITILLTTHYMEEAEALADRIGIMQAGRLLALGTVQELKESAETDSMEKAFIAIVKEGKK